MAPTKKRGSAPGRPASRATPSTCSSCAAGGVCDLNVWLGTLIDPAAARSGERLLRPDLPVVKYKHWSLLALSGPLYHLIILGWVPLLSLSLAVYVAIVGVFALLFAACGSVSAYGARNYFNLSLQTLATIGYGELHPTNACANWVTVLETFVSMLLTSFMTGVAFAKLARPHPTILFSEVFTVSPRDDGYMEMRFRLANGTHRKLVDKGEILEVNFKLILMRVETTFFGEKKLCYYDLHVETSSYITLRLEAELIHVINESSPFFGQSERDVIDSDFLIILMMSGIDETLHDMVHKQYEYSFRAMRWGFRFAPMLGWDDEKRCMTLDFDKLSETTAVDVDVAIQNHDDFRPHEAKQKHGKPIDDDSMDQDLNISDDITRVVERQRVDYKKAVSLADSSRPMAYAGDDDERVEEYGGEIAPIRLGDLDHEDDDPEPEALRRRSESSTKTNSGSEDGGRYNRGVLRLPFDPHIRIHSFRRDDDDHVGHRHDAPCKSGETPMSLLRRKVIFKNHPLTRFASGLYYRALSTSWIQLLALSVLYYYGVIAIIAGVISLSENEVLHQSADLHVESKFERVFFFCTQTISTVGYGALSPAQESDFVNFFVFVLVIVGLMVSTLLTGFTWAKFSIPKASTILFSDKLLITSFHSERAIMFRAANNRDYGVIIEGSFRVSVVLLNRNLGRRETHELELVRNVWPIVHLGNTVTHIIDENSPLFKFSTDDLLSGDHFFVVLFTGLDSVINENMYSRKTYHSCDILVGHQFVDNIKLAADGLHIDLDCIHDTTFTPDTNESTRGLRCDNSPDSSVCSVHDQKQKFFTQAIGRIDNRSTLSANSPSESYFHEMTE